MDRLISLGDVCDRGPEVSKVFEALLEIHHLVYILGNHDFWAKEWFTTGQIPDVWYFQGGRHTINSYPHGVPESHRNLILNAYQYFIDANRLFVHGGIIPGIPVEKQDQNTLIWDRSLVSEALARRSKGRTDAITGYAEIFVGHTPTIQFGSDHPIQACEVWLMDTGAGWGYPLSMMNIDTKEVFRSDPVTQLYDSNLYDNFNQT
jgi:serine/threonine protein phosphatase 1